MRFGAKAALISLAFVLPLALVATFFFTNQAAQIEFSGRSAWVFATDQVVAPLLQAAERQRGAAAAIDAAGSVSPQGIEASMKALADVERELGPVLGTAKAYAQVTESQRALATALSSGGSTDEVHTAFIKSLIGLLVQATDGSNLTLDPDIDSYYLMDGALFRLPDLIEQAGAMRDLGSEMLGTGVASAEQSKRLGGRRPSAVPASSGHR